VKTSLWRDDDGVSRGALIPVAALGLLAIFSLARVFSSPAYLAWGIPATAVGAVFALTFGRRSLLGAFLAMGAVAAFTLPALFARELSFYLFPTSAAYRLVGTLMRSGLSGIVREVAPVPADQRYLIVLWTAGMFGGFLGASWVVVQRPIGAAATAVGLIAYAGSVGKGPGRDLYSFCAVFLLCAFLLGDGRYRISRWSKTVRRVPASVGSATLAVASLLALAGPAILGTTQPWVQVQSALRPRLVIINPLSDIQEQLRNDPPIEVMRVGASTGTYWRLTALDLYTGQEWRLEAKPVAAHNGDVPRAKPPTTGAVVAQRYSITSLLAPWLPAAFAAEAVDSAAPFDIDRGTSTLLLRKETVPGLRYTVTSRLPDTTSPSAITTPLGKPEQDNAALARIAQQAIGRAKTPYEQAIALQNWFRSTFRYNENVPGGHTRARLARFLADRQGYCEQFAATMALMLRGIGTPARVAVGFLPGRHNGREFVVSTRDAHAWVEAHIPGMGWVTFDPTAGRGFPASRGGQQEEEEVAASPSPVPGLGPVPTPERSAEPKSNPIPQPRPATRIPASPFVVAAVLATVPGIKAIRRRSRRRGTPADAVLGAYAELVDRVADLGWRVRPNQTQWESWAHAFEGGRAPGAEAAADVVRLAVLAIYGPLPTAAADAERAWGRLAQGLRTRRRSLSWWRRLAAVFDPRTFVPSGSPASQLAGA
jgi:transglutaminase-like putative cysteine protease